MQYLPKTWPLHAPLSQGAPSPSTDDAKQVKTVMLRAQPSVSSKTRADSSDLTILVSGASVFRLLPARKRQTIPIGNFPRRGQLRIRAGPGRQDNHNVAEFTCFSPAICARRGSLPNKAAASLCRQRAASNQRPEDPDSERDDIPRRFFPGRTRRGGLYPRPRRAGSSPVMGSGRAYGGDGG